MWFAPPVELDVHTVIGGGFSDEELGFSAYRALLDRLHARTGDYLDQLERGVLPRLDDEGLASLYLPNFLKLVQPYDPERVQRMALLLRDRTAEALLRAARRHPPQPHDLFRLHRRFAEFDAIARFQ